VDLVDPTRAVTPSLDGPVLAALARATRPLTVGEITACAARGSEIGVRRCVARLVAQGVVDAVLMGRNIVHTLNREHVAAPIADLLAGLRAELARRLREALGTWHPPPLRAILLSSAPGAPDEVSLLLVHPPRPDEAPAGPDHTRATGSCDLAPAGPQPQPLLEPMGPAPVAMTAEQEQAWRGQLAELAPLVRRWTGSGLRVVEMSSGEVAQRRQRGSRLLDELERGGEVLV
jgi:hypothetical protein